MADVAVSTETKAYNIALCKDCELAFSQMKDNNHRLETEIREKNKMFDGFISVASTQAKHNSYIQLTSLGVTVAQSPSSQMSKALISDFGATLSGLASINAGTGATAVETTDRDELTTGGCPSPARCCMGSNRSQTQGPCEFHSQTDLLLLPAILD